MLLHLTGFVSAIACLLASTVSSESELHVIQTLVGYEVVLNCKLNNNSTNNVTWMKDEKTLEVKTVNITLDPVKYTDRGIYKCNGDWDYNIKLKVLDKPDPPHNLTASDIKSNQVYLAWLPSNNTDQALLSAYIIQQKKNGEWVDVLNVTRNETNAIVHSLHANTNYHFQIRALAGNGNLSDTSNPVYVNTSVEVNTTESSLSTSPPSNTKEMTLTTVEKTSVHPAMMPQPPENFRGIGVTADSMLLKWEYPNGTDVTDIVKYRLYVKPQLDNQQNITIGARRLRYNLSGLDAATKYELNLTCVTDVGEGSPATLVITTDSKGGPPPTSTVVYSPSTVNVTPTNTEPLPGLAKSENKWPQIAAIAGTLLSIVFIIVLLLGYFVWRKSCHANHYYTRADTQSQHPPVELGLPDLKTLLDKDSIEILDFEKHVIEAHADSNHGFSVEYEDIRKVSTKALTFFNSNLPENKNKNRYLDIVAYDQTRVHLAPITGRQKNSDYINANYVDGYDKQRTYIASQGPLKTTVNDFWRMVWEQGSVIVIMLTNLVEKGKRKCEQYWPTEGTELYGYIEVTLEDTNILAAYTIRRFIIKNIKGKKIRGQHGDRMIYQYHYTAWPDHGIPEDSLPVITFVKKSSSANPPDAGPIVVHCSAGVGRTGTYIVIDTMLRQIKATQRVSVLAFMKHIRQQRNYLVQTEDQYIFLHDALLEAIKCGDTEVTVNDYNDYVDQQLENKILLSDDTEISLLEKQFKRINSYMAKDYEFHSATRPYNKAKNRSVETLPVDRSRVKLLPKPGEDGSDYVNASFLQGYRLSQEYIITQHPLEHTAVDFWRMIWDQNSETIVSLISLESMEEGDLMVYWPTTESNSLSCGTFTVNLAEEEHHLNMITRNFLLQSRQDDYMMNVRQYQCGYWPDSCTPETLFELIIAVQKWKQQFEGPVTVHDRLGLTSAATFCALSTLHQQLKHEDSVDSYKIAMLYHLRRPGCFSTKESFQFLYMAMKSAVESKQKERRLGGGGRNHLPSHGGSNHKKYDHHTLNSIRRALSLHEDHRPHSPSQNSMKRSHSMTEPGSPGGSSGWKIKKRSSGTQNPNITEEVETVKQEDGKMAVKWSKHPDVAVEEGDARKLSNNNSSGSDYRESGFEEDEVFVEPV
ncbi:receptor-type tyrosine-protein phosphatase gamma-like isoform X2 [Glandiceps talaboti]